MAQLTIDFNFFTTLGIVFSLTFGFIALILLNVNDHGQDKSACTDNEPCIKVLNGVIVGVVFGALLLCSPYILHFFLSKNVELVLKVLFAVAMLVGAVYAIALQVEIQQPGNNELDDQTRAMQAMVYFNGSFGLVSSAMTLLSLGGQLEKVFNKSL